MAMEEKIQMGSHKLTLQNRGSVMLTGVKDVVAFDENQVNRWNAVVEAGGR